MKKNLILFILLFSFIQQSKGQVVVNEYSESLLSYYAGVDTQYQYLDEIKNATAENKQLKKLFPFSPTQFFGANNKIAFFDTIQPLNDINFTGYVSWGGGANYYKANKLNFKLEQDTSSVYFYKNLAYQDSSTAIIIIPGSGVNQSTGISIYNPANYHNTNCMIASLCQNYGDVYTYVRPDEDFMAIWTTVAPNVRKKMGYTALNQKTNLLTKNWAANGYIQIIALTKYLKTKYNKVIIIGLSAGSWGAFFTAIQSEPDAAQVASGYSINFNGLTYYYNPEQFQFDGLFSGHPIDSLKKTIKNQSTQYLFSYGSNDPVQYMAEENSVHTTQNFLNTPEYLPNTSFFYNFSNHRFPCESLDTFFTRIKKMPKADMKITNSCTSDSAIVKFSFIGKAPYHFDLMRNDTLVSAFVSNSDTFYTKLLLEGRYTIKNLLDSNHQAGFKSKPLDYIKVKKLLASNMSNNYICNTDSTLVELNLSGTSPFIINSYNNISSINDSLISTGSNFQHKYVNGNYTISSILDSNKCILNYNQNILINNNKLAILLSNPIYNCDSNKTQIHFDLQGNSPWTINYKFNGVAMQINTSDVSFDKYFTNGTYQFLNITDSTNCSKNINQFFNFNYNPISVSTTTPMYNCDSNKTRIDYTFQGNSPFVVDYTQDANPMQFTSNTNTNSQFYENGNYNIQTVTDATGCVAALNQHHVFMYDTIDIALSTPFYNCDSNKTQIHVDLQGNAPWTIHYKLNGVAMQINTSDVSFDNYFTNGTYQFLNIIDATNCNKNINQIFNFNYNPIAVSTTTPMYNCDSNKTRIDFTFQGNSPFVVDYTQDANPMQFISNTNTNSQFYENGNYNFQTVIDATGCVAALNQNHVFMYDTIDIALSTPFYNCDSNKTQIHVDLQGNAPWTIHYKFNGVAMQINTSDVSFDNYFTNGTYQFLNIIDATNCSKNINQIFNFNYNPIAVSSTTPMYNCDSNKTRIDFTFQGNSPFVVDYTHDANPMQFTSNTNTSSQFYENGNYNFQTVIDATGCVAALNQHHVFMYDTIDIALSTPFYNCDSNKTQIHVDLQGNAPWTINYKLNGVAMQINTSDVSFDNYFTNGAYQFLNIIDATNCSKNINQFFNFNYNPIAVSSTTPMYNCDSNKTQIDYTFQGNSPFVVDYTHDANPMQFISNTNTSSQFYENGNYNFQTVIDATGCVAAINQNHVFMYDTIDIALSTPFYNCDSNKTQIHVDLQGNAPWTINYKFNGVAMQINTSDVSFDNYFTNGTYQFLNIIDATNCSKNINQFFNFNYNPIAVSSTTPMYNCDSNKTQIVFTFQGNSPFGVDYTQDANPMQFTSNTNTSSQFYENGNYNFQTLTDATGCVAAVNQNHVFMYDTIDIALSTPVYNCDSNKTQIHVDLQGNAPWIIEYEFNGNTVYHSTTSPTIDLFLINNEYHFISVTDGTGCTKLINQLININYKPLSYIIPQQTYDCDSNKYRIDFTLTGNAPWTIQYQISGGQTSFSTSYDPSASIWLANGYWTIDNITDATNCSVSLNMPIFINFEAINAAISSQQYDCDSNKMRVELNLQGNAPWTIQYVNAAIGIPQQVTSLYSNPTIFLGNGIFQFQQVTDNTQCTKAMNQLITNLYTPLSIQKTNTSHQCDSNKLQIEYALTGDGPWTIQYENLTTNLITQHTTYNTNTSLFLPTGNYVIRYVSDAKCTININDTINVNFPLLSALLTPFTLNCDSAFYSGNLFISSGLMPYRLEYTFNNQPYTLFSNQISKTINLNNGTYYFEKIKDSVGCEIPINKSFTSNYHSFDFVNASAKYNCLVDSSYIDIEVASQNPLWLVYSKNMQANDTLLMSSIKTQIGTNNTEFNLHYIYDAEGCIDTVNKTLSINENPITVKVDSLLANCDNKEYELTINATGKAPWMLYYNFNNIQDSLLLTSANEKWNVPSGQYYFVRATDANECEYNIRKNEILYPFTPFDVIIETDFKHVYTTASPLEYDWYFNGLKFDSLNNNIVKVKGEGDYYVLVSDSAGCIYQSNTLNIDFPSNINLYPNPTAGNTNILINEAYGDSWNYKIIDIAGNEVDKGTVRENYVELKTNLLAAGIYTVMIEYATDSGNIKKVVRLIKN